MAELVSDTTIGGKQAATIDDVLNNVGNYAVATGYSNNYLATYAPAITALIEGMELKFKANHINTGAATLNVNGLGAVPLKKQGSLLDLSAYDIGMNQIVKVTYDGTYFQVSNTLNILLPVGMEILWPAESIPYGWLEEDGSSLLRSRYPELFAVIGTLYGAADAAHFNLPDMRGKFPRVWDHTAGIDPDAATRTAPTATGATITAGDHVGTEQDEEFKSHTHSAPPKTAAHDEMFGDGCAGDGAGGASSYTSGAAGGAETRPVNVNRVMIIRYTGTHPYNVAPQLIVTELLVPTLAVISVTTFCITEEIPLTIGSATVSVPAPPTVAISTSVIGP